MYIIDSSKAITKYQYSVKQKTKYKNTNATRYEAPCPSKETVKHLHGAWARDRKTTLKSGKKEKLKTEPSTLSFSSKSLLSELSVHFEGTMKGHIRILTLAKAAGAFD
jgi:hypothetical protein